MKLQLYSKFSVNLFFFIKIENVALIENIIRLGDAHQEHHCDDLICSSKY
jgi:hypothetical protein